MSTEPSAEATLDPTTTGSASRPAALLCLTIAYHPDLRRIGERAFVDPGTRLELSRLCPEFAAPGGDDSRPLEDPYLSRRSIAITCSGQGCGATLSAEVQSLATLEGAPLRDASLSVDALERGQALVLGRRVVLWIHRTDAEPPSAAHGLVGASPLLSKVRRQIEQVADLDTPVLIRGETGVGKELVALAVHRRSQRADAPFLSLDAGALPTTLVASHLFGHAKGAFTGALTSRIGLFELADRGTLFLDEIGEAPLDVQRQLLRALETRTFTRLGEAEERHTNARFLAATDANLEQAVSDGQFRSALLHRLAGFVVQVPALRARREDIPRLTVRFLEEALDHVGEPERLEQNKGSKLWFPRDLMLRFLSAEWPGNVRQLKNVVSQLAIDNRGQQHFVIDESITQQLEHRPDATDAGSVPSCEPARLEATLAAHAWAPGPTAAALGIPRSTLYDWMARANIRAARDVTDDELKSHHEQCGGNLDEMVSALRVSRRGIQLRLRTLGLE